MSYLDVNRFIDNQVKLLNEPLTLDDDILQVCRQFGISDSQVRSILFKCNLQIKRQVRANFERPLVHEIIKKVMLSEKNSIDDSRLAGSKLEQLICLAVDEALASSWTIANKVRRIDDLASCMPEGKLIIVGDKESIKTEDGVDDQKRDTNPVGPRIEPTGHIGASLIKTEESNETRQSGENGDNGGNGYNGGNGDNGDNTHTNTSWNETAIFRERYEQLRAEFMLQHSQLLYQAQKLEYLQNLRKSISHKSQQDDSNGNASQERSADLSRETERFEKLAERLYKDQNEN